MVGGCGTCETCESGDEQLCRRPRNLGVNVDGGYSDHVIVPHPRYRRRRFVLEPLVEAWPDAHDPDGTPVADLLGAVADQPVVPLDLPGWPA